jgi:ribosomal protein S13
VGKRVGIFLKHLLFLRMKSLRRLKMLRSFRHSLFLPVRGQRTRKNAKTQKKKKKDKKKIQIPNKKKK